MRKVVSIIEKLPVWYGLTVMLLYSLLTAELLFTFLKLFPFEEVFSNIFRVILGVSYVVSVLSGFISWIIYSLLFHLTATLFGGQSLFKHFLVAATYPYLIPACIAFIGIVLLNEVQPLILDGSTDIFMQDPTMQLIKNLLNYSHIPYYLIVIILIRYIYQIKYIYAALSVGVPLTVIWLISELVKLTIN